MKKINLFILNLTLTLRCTLKCKLCVADIAKYETPPHFSKEFLFEAMKKSFSIIDYVERFQLSGGEPLIHKDFAEILENALNYSSQFGFLGIFSNGTIVPDKETIEVINKFGDKSKVKFFISHYGEHSKKVPEIENILSQNNINYEVKIYHGENQHFDGWVDYGNYEKQNYNEEELVSLFNDCAANRIGGIWSCRYGEIHRCTRSASGTDLGAIPKIKGDYIDLFADISDNEQKEMLRLLINKPYITACSYCTGNFGTNDVTKRFPAAEQIRE